MGRTEVILHFSSRPFQFQTGTYYVGSAKNAPPALALNDGQQMKPSDIIAAFKMANNAVPPTYSGSVAVLFRKSQTRQSKSLSTTSV